MTIQEFQEAVANKAKQNIDAQWRRFVGMLQAQIESFGLEVPTARDKTKLEAFLADVNAAVDSNYAGLSAEASANIKAILRFVIYAIGGVNGVATLPSKVYRAEEANVQETILNLMAISLNDEPIQPPTDTEEES